MEGRWDRSSEGRKKRRKKGKRGRVKNSRPFERSNGVKTGKLVQLLWSTVWRFLKKTGHRTAIRPSNPTAGHTHQGNQN